MKGLYDLVTVCSERIIFAGKRQSLTKVGKTVMRDDLRVRKPAGRRYRSIVYVPDHEELIVPFSFAPLCASRECYFCVVIMFDDHVFIACSCT